MLFNIYLSENCSLCPKVWEQCEPILKKNKFLYNVNKSSAETLKKDNTLPMYDENYVARIRITPEAFPAIGLFVKDQPYLFYGDGMIEVLRQFIKLGEQNFVSILPK